MSVTLEVIPYAGWPDSLRLANGQVELVVTTAIGPRVAHWGFPGQPNVLGLRPDLLGQRGGDEWRNYGGHRLWHAPEAIPRTYAPDNAPARWERQPDGARVTQALEASTGIEKELEISLVPGQAQARLVHRLRNRNLWPVRLAAWALSVMAPGGVAVLPLPPRAPWGSDHLLPNGRLALWPYTDLADPRWTWGVETILLRQDPAQPAAQKIGLDGAPGWAAYAHPAGLFIKSFSVLAGAEYPDENSALEVFVNGEILELETLGPLTTLAPGAALEHVETWRLLPPGPRPETEAAARALLPAGL